MAYANTFGLQVEIETIKWKWEKTASTQAHDTIEINNTKQQTAQAATNNDQTNEHITRSNPKRGSRSKSWTATCIKKMPCYELCL